MALRSDLLHPKPASTLRIAHADLMALPEYSTSLPTGKAPGFRWRRDDNFRERRALAHLHFWDGSPEPGADGESWYVGEYHADPADPNAHLITWHRALVT